MQEFYQSDNKGNRVSHPHTADPILASAQKVVAGSKNTDATITVVAGQAYIITSLEGHHVFGIATTATAANCVWAAPAGATIIIKVPHGYTALHYQTPSDTRTFYIRKLA